MKFLKLFSLVCLLGSFATSRAQFKLSAEIRPRAEFRDGFKRPLNKSEKPAFFVEQRTRLYIEYHNDKLDLMLVPQDVRIWGNSDQAAKVDRSLLNMEQAWAAYRFNNSSRILAGRLELDYDNARILGNLDWAQQGRSHDLLKYEYNGVNTHFHFGAAFNQNNDIPEPNKLAETNYMGLNNYKSMQFAWLNKHFKKQQISILALNEGRQYAPDTVYYLQTIGTYVSLNFSPFTIIGEYYFQTGKNKTGTKTQAYLAALATRYNFAPSWYAEIGNDYLTGDDPKTNKSEAFDPLYGTQHKFYGTMDYFYAGNAHANKGLNDLFLKLAWQNKTIGVNLDAHRFTAAADIFAAADQNRLHKYLGTELDCSFSYAVDQFFNLKGGYSHLFYTQSMRELKQVNPSGSQASWAWIMLTFKPVLFQN